MKPKNKTSLWAMKLNWQTSVLVSVVFLWALWLILPYTVPKSPPTPVIATPEIHPGMGLIQSRSAFYAGIGNSNCGRVAPYEKRRAAADACAVAAFKARRPFRLIYHAGYRTNEEMWGIAGNAKGRVYFLHLVEGYEDYYKVPKLTVYTCKKPIIASSNGRSRIACQEKPNLTP